MAQYHLYIPLFPIVSGFASGQFSPSFSFSSFLQLRRIHLSATVNLRCSTLARPRMNYIEPVTLLLSYQGILPYLVIFAFLVKSASCMVNIFPCSQNGTLLPLLSCCFSVPASLLKRGQSDLFSQKKGCLFKHLAQVLKMGCTVILANLAIPELDDTNMLVLRI